MGETTIFSERVSHAEETIKRLIEQVGGEAFLRALGSQKFPLGDLPAGKRDEYQTVLRVGRMHVCTVDRGELGRYTCLRRDPAGIVIVPLFMGDDGKVNVVFTEQVRGGVGMLFTELPAGGPKESESTIETAMRELHEETGYRPIESTAQVVQKESGYSASGYTTDRQKVVQVWVEKTPGERSSSTSDAAQIKRVFAMPLEEAARIYADGRSPGAGAIDTKTAAAVMAAAIRMNLADPDFIRAKR
jgi:8-oxo-dGTP pyrophosphatase MutT (NUDIX family)